MDYFSQFGTITDITIPQPFRSFAFITFQESSKLPRPVRLKTRVVTRPDGPENLTYQSFSGDAISILDQDHLIKGVSVVTRSADPIQEPNKNSNR